MQASRLTADAPERRLSQTRSATLGSRSRASGDPNTPELPRWPAFDAAQRATMVFDNASVVQNDPLREQRLAMFAALDLAT